MKALAPALVALTLLAIALPGCSTSKPGVTNTFGNLRAVVDADPHTTADAAEAALSELELLRITSESTNLYDPSWSLWRAQAVLRRQWALCVQIASEVRDRQGIKPKGPLRLLREAIRYYRGRHVSTLSD